MRAVVFVPLFSALVLLAQPAVAGGLVEAAELEHARANARAGGPVSERDKELLERYGCTSGTNHPICRGERWSKTGYRAQKPKKSRRD